MRYDFQNWLVLSKCISIGCCKIWQQCDVSQPLWLAVKNAAIKYNNENTTWLINIYNVYKMSGVDMIWPTRNNIKILLWLVTTSKNMKMLDLRLLFWPWNHNHWHWHHDTRASALKFRRLCQIQYPLSMNLVGVIHQKRNKHSFTVS